MLCPTLIIYPKYPAHMHVNLTSNLTIRPSENGADKPLIRQTFEPETPRTHMLKPDYYKLFSDVFFWILMQ